MPPPSCPPSLWAVLLAALYRRFRPGFRLVRLLCSRLVSRRCHNILALPGLSAACGTMRVLTPARRHLGRQVSLLISRKLPAIPSSTTGCARPSFCQPFQRGRRFSRLRPTHAGSPQHPAESGSCAYGLVFHLQLLPTPPHGDAVTFDYGVMAFSDTDLHRAVYAPSQAHMRFVSQRILWPSIPTYEPKK